MALPEKKDFVVYRGDPDTLTFTIDGDLTGKELLFATKKDRELTSFRLIDKTGTAIEIIYDHKEHKSYVSVHIIAEDTQDLTYKYLEYDLINITDDKTIASGRIYITSDTITPYDNFALPENAVRFLQLDASSGADYDIIQVRIIDGEKKLVFISLSELKNQLNNI